MNLVKRVAPQAVLLLVLAMTTASLWAHQVTFKGTVISVEKTIVKVTVVDEKTKKPGPMTFDFDKETKILRGDKLVTIEQAAIQKGEKIAVTVDHDADEKFAIRIQLDARRGAGDPADRVKK